MGIEDLENLAYALDDPDISVRERKSSFQSMDVEFVVSVKVYGMASSMSGQLGVPKDGSKPSVEV